jgi:hypothetical protein
MVFHPDYSSVKEEIRVEILQNVSEDVLHQLLTLPCCDSSVVAEERERLWVGLANHLHQQGLKMLVGGRPTLAGDVSVYALDLLWRDSNRGSGVGRRNLMI